LCQLGFSWGSVGGGNRRCPTPNDTRSPQPTLKQPNRCPTDPTTGQSTRSARSPPILRVLNPFLASVCTSSWASLLNYCFTRMLSTIIASPLRSQQHIKKWLHALLSSFGMYRILLLFLSSQAIGCSCLGRLLAGELLCSPAFELLLWKLRQTF